MQHDESSWLLQPTRSTASTTGPLEFSSANSAFCFPGVAAAAQQMELLLKLAALSNSSINSDTFWLSLTQMNPTLLVISVDDHDSRKMSYEMTESLKYKRFFSFKEWYLTIVFCFTDSISNHFLKRKKTSVTNTGSPLTAGVLPGKAAPALVPPLPAGLPAPTPTNVDTHQFSFQLTDAILKIQNQQQQI